MKDVDRRRDLDDEPTNGDTKGQPLPLRSHDTELMLTSTADMSPVPAHDELDTAE